MKIAPYLAQSVSRSYLRQQRIGERIAESRVRSEGVPPRPAVQLELSQAAQQASEDALRQAEASRDEQLSLVSERFAERLVAQGGGGEGLDGDERTSGLDKVLEGVGLAIQKGEEGEADVIVRKDTGEVLSELAPEALDLVKEVLRDSARRVLDGLI